MKGSFTIEITEREDNSLLALMTCDGCQTAIESEPVENGSAKQRHSALNLFRNIENVFMERRFPEFAMKYKAVALPDGKTVANVVP